MLLVLDYLNPDIKPARLQIYSETRKNVLSNDILHEVAILRDGFSQFQVKYKVCFFVP